MIATWSLLAAALLVVAPLRGAPSPAAGPHTGSGPASRTLLGVAATAAAGACVALFGPVAGGLAAVVVGPAAWFGLARVRSRPSVPGTDRTVALVLDLTAAALRAGRPPADALAATALAADTGVRQAFERVAGLLRLGAEPGQAWSVLSGGGPLAPVAVVAVRSAASGARLATAFERLAGELRVEAAATAAARAQRAGIVAMAPLGLCFLPSFVLLGVVPVVVGVARTALGGVS